MSGQYFKRFPWPNDFPDVVIHSLVKERETHPAYKAAKSGDPWAAIRCSGDLIDREAVDHLRRMIGDKQPLLAAVSAIEAGGFNAIPDAIAMILGEELGTEIERGKILQMNKVAHTKVSGFRRLVTPAGFEGEVKAGRNYVLVDDHVGFGGTLANMRGYIESKGGKVIGMTTLTETREARKIGLTDEKLNMLRLNHGQELENLWRDAFGHGFECLTNVEAGYLGGQPSVDAIRDRLAEAAEEARAGGLSAVAVAGKIKDPGPG